MIIYLIVIHCSSSLHFTTFFYANSTFASHKCIAGLITITTLLFTLSIDQSITRSNNDRLLNWSIAALTRVVVGVHIKHTSLLVQLIIVCPQCIFFFSFLVRTPQQFLIDLIQMCANYDRYTVYARQLCQLSQQSSIIEKIHFTHCGWVDEEQHFRLDTEGSFANELKVLFF